jgi:crotonobetainyl-CoA:carnitine CoA-transferase CaiB-like acyl-CoA transferase
LVLDLSRVPGVPYASMTLGDLDAEVIKVARPDGGDDTLQWIIFTWRQPKPTGLPHEFVVKPFQV